MAISGSQLEQFTRVALSRAIEQMAGIISDEVDPQRRGIIDGLLKMAEQMKERPLSMVDG